ncbi:hypothetical protein GY21_01505 [Cryobacterium roopkundense]|uniref:Uncharacterized protein n=1 Tax=Cryobacterium roopkundense TaxID=1001240 RepID=A0A099JWJ7_9MICO|nr:hypothetical protein [Cryobacterium roopkundense]KGJ81778.1 hypothetical protein GY21_01505 [Cryobacterium roopkundense]MBB5642411.1 hypothetical protein [Cryobacterium roopkundense]
MSGALAETAQISAVTLKLWTRELASIFHTTERRVRASVLCVAAAAAAFGLLLAVASAAQLTQNIPEVLRLNIVRTAFGSAILIPAIVTTILCVTMPARTSLQTLLDLLPVARRVSRAGQVGPSFVLGLGFSAVLCSTTIAVVAKLYPDPLHIALALALLVAVIVIVQGLSMGIFTLIASGLRRYGRLPQQYSAAVAGCSVIALGVAAIAADLLTFRPAVVGEFTAADLLLHRAAAGVLTDPAAPGPWLVMLAWASLSAAILTASFSVYRQEQGTDAIRLFRGSRPRHTPASAAIWLEELLSVRNPQAIMTVVILVPAVFALHLMAAVPPLRDLAHTLALSAPVFPFFLAVYAVGRTLRVHWLGVHLIARPLWWVSPKIVAYAVGGTVLGSLVFAVEVLIGLAEPSSAAQVGARAVLALGAALLAGTVVPYSDEQPLSMTVSGFLAAFIYLVIVSLLAWLQDFTPDALIWLITLVSAAGLLLAYAGVASAHSTDDVRRA